MLEYLSDDEIAGRAERKARQSKRKAKRSTKKATRKTKRSTRKSGRKSGDRPRTIARIGLAPARGAFLTIMRFNIGKMATKIVRVYKKKGGKEKLQKFWIKFGGKKWKTFTNAVSKGSKQQISADEIGQGMAVAIATATPILIVLAKIFKEFKVNKKGEEQEFDDIISDGKSELADNPEFETGSAYMPEGEDVALLQYEGGDGEPKGGSFLSVSGFMFKAIFVLMFSDFTDPVLAVIASIIATYSIVGIAMYFIRDTFAGKIYFLPFKLFSHGKK